MKRKQKEGTILTNDPSMTAWGWAVIHWDGIVEEVGCMKTEPESKVRRIRKGDDTMRRADDLSRVLNKILKLHDVQYILTEVPHGSQSAQAADKLGICKGLVIDLARSNELPIEWYMEWDAKKFLFNKKSVTKEETIQKVKLVLGDRMSNDLWTGVGYKDEAIADALAIYLTAVDQSSALKLMKNR